MEENESLFNQITELYARLNGEYEELVYQACSGEKQGEEIYHHIISKSLEITQVNREIIRARLLSDEIDAMFAEWQEKILNPQKSRFIN